MHRGPRGRGGLEQPQGQLERPRQVLRSRRKAVAGPVHEVAMSASLDLEFIGERLRLGFGGSLGGLATSFAGRARYLECGSAAKKWS